MSQNPGENRQHHFSVLGAVFCCLKSSSESTMAQEASRRRPRVCARRRCTLSAALLISSQQKIRAANALSPSHPCLGRATVYKTNYFVIGTSHFRCQSAQEVKSLIRDIKPDGVVVELDPERVIRLSKEGSKHPNEEQLFGADFLAAIDTARDMDVPLFIGDEYTRDTRERFALTAFDPSSYGPSRLMTAFVSFFLPERQRNANANYNYVNVLLAFVSDPMKVAPLAAAASPSFLLLLATIQHYRIEDVGDDAATALSLLFSFLATTKVFNNFISDRDDILARNAVRAADVISSLRKKETIRARWTFTVDGNDAKSIRGANEEEVTEQGSRSGGSRTPLFTLKTPLECGKTRHLNLFEQRWLKMIDDISANSATRVDSQSFGCVTCTNKFYSAIQIDGAEARYADVIFQRSGTMAEIIDLVEGQRPSGDRKIGVRIEGRNTFFVDEKKLAISKEGYLVASGVGKEITESMINNAPIDNQEDLNIVVVVGLLHANGVIQRLAN
jgi:hypothetical protein